MLITAGPHIRVLLYSALALAVLLPILSAYARSRPTVGVRLKPGWGIVYVLRDCQNTHLFKIGLTTRSCKTRMSEVSRDMAGGADLEAVYSVRVPFAATVEQVAHNRLKRKRWHSERGFEWFRLGDENQAIRVVRKSVRDVRRMAKRQRRWSWIADRDMREI